MTIFFNLTANKSLLTKVALFISSLIELSIKLSTDKPPLASRNTISVSVVVHIKKNYVSFLIKICEFMPDI